jgi:uncharacterized protein
VTDVLRGREGVAVRLDAGERLRIVNLDGAQVVDTWALNAADPTEHMSMEHTRTSLSKLTPALGDDLYSSRRRPLLTLVEDTSSGVHDTLLAACDAERYRQLGGPEGHANCAENYVRALAAVDIHPGFIPGPLNLFMNIPWETDGTLAFRQSPARPNDYVTLAAALDVIVVLSACPMDLNPINGGEPTDIALEKLR